MARPQKVGLEYFNLYTVFTDDKIDLMEAECGLEGFAILIKLWQKIYLEGYYIDWEDDNAILFARKINSNIDLINSVVTACFKREIFNKDLYDKYKILTSSGIQKRYLTIYKQLKRSHIPMIKEYLLIDTELINVITELTSINPELSTQSKVKETKVKESILNTTTKDIGTCSSSSADTGVDKNKELSKIALAFQGNGFGSINGTVKEMLLELLDIYSAEWIIEAMRIAVESNKRSLRYVKGILENWQRDGGMKLTKDKSNAAPKVIAAKKNRFHNFNQRSDMYSGEEINSKVDEIAKRKREELRNRKGGQANESM